MKRRKLQWYGHVSRSSGLAKIILQGTVNGQTEEEAGRQHQGMDRPGVRQVPNDPCGYGIDDNDDDDDNCFK